MMWSFVSAFEADELVNHSAQVLRDLWALDRGNLGATASVRGFYLGHRVEALKDYDDFVAKHSTLIGDVQALTIDNPQQQQLISRISTLIDLRISKTKQMIELGKAGQFDQALKLGVDSQLGAVINELQDSIDESVALERGLLLQRGALAISADGLIERVMLTGSGVAIVILLIAAYSAARRLRQPLEDLRLGTAAISQGDFSHRIPVRAHDEFGDLADAFNAMGANLSELRRTRELAALEMARMNSELTERTRDLQLRTGFIEALVRMSTRLQTAISDEEFGDVVSRHLPMIIHDRPGALYLHNNSRNLLVRTAQWTFAEPLAAQFTPPECWALRRGQPHLVVEKDKDIICSHVDGEATLAYACYPLSAQGDIIGLLYLTGRAQEADFGAIDVLTEQIALALANHRLRLSLREQSIRDPLTGLFNRRYMEESLSMELSRAIRTRAPVSVVMLDIDHFKRFNDTFGHDAGDALLQAAGKLMPTQFRDGDVLCRYGGEEFLVIMPGASMAEAEVRAEALRAAVKNLSVVHRGQNLGVVSMSFGIASFPSHAKSSERIVQLADAALIRAKRNGRDRIELADSLAS
jgi:diguanylate cyclase (GGDEF)-like protein